MRPTKILLPAALFAVCLVVGCGNPSSRLIGKWEAELAPPTTESSSIEDRIKSGLVSLLKMNVEFTADGRMNFQVAAMGQSTNTGGTWKYLKSEGNVLVLEIKPDNATASSVARVTMLDDNHIELVPPEGAPTQEALRFKRLTPQTSTTK
jgi:hypothetical protein